MFRGLRWPRVAAVAGQQQFVVPLADGTPSAPSGFVNLSVARGKGRPWEPEPTDASWRSLAELDLGDVASTRNFVAFRGDPYGKLAPDSPITTVTWFPLVEALRLVARLWLPADAAGTSYPASDPAQYNTAWGFRDRPAVQHLLATLTVVPDSSGGGLALSAPTLAAFLAVRTAMALGSTAPHRRCDHCGIWFEVRQTGRAVQSRFCSPSCRALKHQET
jgi:hypothetical protein